MKRNFTLLLALPLLLWLPVSTLLAQAPPNDECSTAKHIADPTLYCSDQETETNFNATPSNVPAPTCTNVVQNDVWYSFTAVSPQVEILVFANILSSMDSPSITLYSGDCTNGLIEIGCVEGTFATQYQNLNVTGLTVGQTYYIRIGSVFSGNFQLCIQNGLGEGQVSADCPTATLLCDKDPLFVPFVSGPGADPTEWDGVSCLIGFSGEDNSSWFVFTAATDGTLEFTLTPENPDDDLDFLVFHLPNGPDDCADRILERCMVAGAFSPTQGCYGPTGLNATATDISQPPGCLPGDDNFLQYMDLVAGETYALSVNNFTTSGSGYTIDWAGTAEFLGPKVGLKSDDADNMICIGQEITFTDTISGTGTVVDWRWTYGNNSSPFSDTTQGPHTVQYLNDGLKTIELIVHTDLGCFGRKRLEVMVDSCCAVMASVDLLPDCLPDTSCLQAAAVVHSAIGPYVYTWSDGQTDSIATMLPAGEYMLTVQDARGCSDTVNFIVKTNGKVEIPNAFTPNGDQANDIFQPVSTASNVQILQIQVWNRWGNLVYDGTNAGWDGKIDGKPAASDVYISRVKIKWPDGRIEVRKSDLTLLR